jgi:hypothetical protein
MGFIQVLQLLNKAVLHILQQIILVQRGNYVLAAALTCCPQAGEGSQGKCASGLQAGNTILTNGQDLRPVPPCCCQCNGQATLPAELQLA